MAKQLILGEFQAYESVYNGGYTKKKATVHAVSPGGSPDAGNVIGVMKGEPVMDSKGKLVTWAYYMSGGKGVGKGKPVFFSSPRAALKYIQENSPLVKGAEEAYDKAEGYVDPAGGKTLVEDAFEKALAKAGAGAGDAEAHGIEGNQQ